MSHGVLLRSYRAFSAVLTLIETDLRALLAMLLVVFVENWVIFFVSAGRNFCQLMCLRLLSLLLLSLSADFSLLQLPQL